MQAQILHGIKCLLNNIPARSLYVIHCNTWVYTFILDMIVRPQLFKLF